MTTELAEHTAVHPAEQVVHGAEQIVLGSLMLDPTAVDRVAARLAAGQFYRTRHGEIYRHLLAAHTAGEPVDPYALGRRLDAVDELGRAGGISYLHDLVAAVPIAAQVDHYVGIVLDAADQRTIAAQAERLRYASGITEPDRRRQLVDEIAGTLTGQPARDGDSWTPLNLGPYLRGEIQRPEPSIGVYRRDGVRFIYPGKEHSVIGEMESGKSWFALACVAAELDAGNTVVYIHFEESDPSDTVERLQALGVPDHVIAERFRFVAPTSAVTVAQIARLIAEPAPSLVILDGVNEGMALHGAAIREEDGVAQFRRTVITPFIRAGCAVLTCDHVVKDAEARGRYALGSIHKGNALSGALIVLENADPFGRGARGRSHVYVTKDRPGHLRQHGRPTKTPGKTYVGELIVDDTRTHVSYLDLAILAPADEKPATTGGDQADELADAVHQVVTALPGGVGSERALFAEMRKAGWQVRESAIRTAVDDLIAAHRLAETTGKRGAKGYRATAAPTAAQDPKPEDPP